MYSHSISPGRHIIAEKSYEMIMITNDLAMFNISIINYCRRELRSHRERVSERTMRTDAKLKGPIGNGYTQWDDGDEKTFDNNQRSINCSLFVQLGLINIALRVSEITNAIWLREWKNYLFMQSSLSDKFSLNIFFLFNLPPLFSSPRS